MSTFLLRRPFRSLVVAGFLLIGSAGCGGKPQEAAETAPAAPVKAEPAEEATLEEWLELPGTTQPVPNRSARISAAVAGQVLAVLKGRQGKPVAEGQWVKKGQVVVQLDDRIIKQERDQAAGALKLAEIEFKSEKAAQGTARSPVALEKAQVARDNAEAKLRSLEEQLRLYFLSAPIDGHLGRVLVVPGQTVAAGAVIADVIDLENEIDLLCFAHQFNVKKLRIGQEAQMIQEAGEQAAATAPQGKVVLIVQQAEPDTGGFAVKVRFPNRELHLRANLAVRVRILTRSKEKALTIPEEALMEDQDPPTVVVVQDVEMKEGKKERFGKAQALRAKIGVRDRVKKKVEILGLETLEKKEPVPLSKDLLFVVEGGHGLKDDDRVKLEEEEHKEEK